MFGDLKILSGRIPAGIANYTAVKSLAIPTGEIDSLQQDVRMSRWRCKFMKRAYLCAPRSVISMTLVALGAP
jgi:hypothetical protein